MASGLQIWSPDGRIILDTTNRCGRVLGIIFIGGSNGAISVPGFVQAPGTPFCAFSPNEIFGTVTGQIISPTFSFPGGATLQWIYPPGGANIAAPAIKSGWAIYGVF